MAKNGFKLGIRTRYFEREKKPYVCHQTAVVKNQSKNCFDFRQHSVFKPFSQLNDGAAARITAAYGRATVVYGAESFFPFRPPRNRKSVLL